MDLAIWGYIFGGAAVFALVLGLASLVNHRLARKEIREFTEQQEWRRDQSSTATKLP